MLVLKTGDAKFIVERKKQQRYYSEHLMYFNFLMITVSDIGERQNIFNLPASSIEIIKGLGILRVVKLRVTSCER